MIMVGFLLMLQERLSQYTPAQKCAPSDGLCKGGIQCVELGNPGCMTSNFHQTQGCLGSTSIMLSHRSEGIVNETRSLCFPQARLHDPVLSSHRTSTGILAPSATARSPATIIPLPHRKAPRARPSTAKVTSPERLALSTGTTRQGTTTASSTTGTTAASSRRGSPWAGCGTGGRSARSCPRRTRRWPRRRRRCGLRCTRRDGRRASGPCRGSR
mmetsp:Transcript_22588/g.61512  ORF Transcript_22588/g.61512 Transcript_22588/m.61512 type:complete len:214 (+) Transcript_22588:59-700(+)